MSFGARPVLWILEDQLAHGQRLLREHPEAPVLLVESRKFMSSRPFHKRRLVFLVAAMRAFAAELRARGRVVYHQPMGSVDSVAALSGALSEFRADHVLVLEPSEFHTSQWITSLPERLGVPVHAVPNDMFLTDRQEFASWARGVSSPLMETFYRSMRKKYSVLMDGAKPVGGVWNLDRENRRAFDGSVLVPPVPQFAPTPLTRSAIDDVDRYFPTHPGVSLGFSWPVCRADAVAALGDFLDHRLPHFGDFEDAMVSGQPALFHSLLSPLINAGLLTPMECIRAAEERWRSNRAPLNAVEGFVRQLLGWREYVYGIYWTFMPEYRERNSRRDGLALPQVYWSGQTAMNCLRQCVNAVVDNAYSHHIQRLMVLCNYATLVGVSPQELNEWFYAMYIDSHDWVVTPNVIGMGVAADGGTMATKPYVSSGAYIDRMSDYCSACRFDVKKKVGDLACPFNSLYWAFIHKHAAEFRRNPRMSMMVRQLEKMEADTLSGVLDRAESIRHGRVKLD